MFSIPDSGAEQIGLGSILKDVVGTNFTSAVFFVWGFVDCLEGSSVSIHIGSEVAKFAQVFL
jgi:hypothetical protein